jgi:hypothetical protein
MEYSFSAIEHDLETNEEKDGACTFKIGITLPLNSDAKSTIIYSQWTSSANEFPTTTAFKKNKFGVSKGVSFGFSRLIGLDKFTNYMTKN